MRVLLASVLLVAVAFALPIPDEDPGPGFGGADDIIVSPDKPLILIVDPETSHVHVHDSAAEEDGADEEDGDDEEDAVSDEDDTDEDDADDGIDALTLMCTRYPKALECKDIIVLQPTNVDLAAPAISVLPSVDHFGDVEVKEVQSDHSAPPAPGLIKDLPEGSHLTGVGAEEVSSDTILQAKGLRDKRQLKHTIDQVISNLPAPVGLAVKQIQPELSHLADVTAKGIESVLSGPSLAAFNKVQTELNNLGGGLINTTQSLIHAPSIPAITQALTEASHSADVATKNIQSILLGSSFPAADKVLTQLNNLGAGLINTTQSLIQAPSIPAMIQALTEASHSADVASKNIQSILLGSSFPAADKVLTQLNNLGAGLINTTQSLIHAPSIPAITQALTKASHSADVAMKNIRSILLAQAMDDVNKVLPIASDVAAKTPGPRVKRQATENPLDQLLSAFPASVGITVKQIQPEITHLADVTAKEIESVLSGPSIPVVQQALTDFGHSVEKAADKIESVLLGPSVPVLTQILTEINSLADFATNKTLGIFSEPSIPGINQVIAELGHKAEVAMKNIQFAIFSKTLEKEKVPPNVSNLADVAAEEAKIPGQRVKRQARASIWEMILTVLPGPVGDVVRQILPQVSQLADVAVKEVQSVFSAPPAPDAIQDLPEGSHLAEAPVEEALSAVPTGDSGLRVKRQATEKALEQILAFLPTPAALAVKQIQPEISRLADVAAREIESVLSAPSVPVVKKAVLEISRSTKVAVKKVEAVVFGPAVPIVKQVLKELSHLSEVAMKGAKSVISDPSAPVVKKALTELSNSADASVKKIQLVVFTKAVVPDVKNVIPNVGHLAEDAAKKVLSAIPIKIPGIRVKRQSWGQISIDVISNIIKPVRKAIQGLPDLNKLAEDALNGIEQVFSAPQATETAQDLPEGSHLAEAPVEEALSATSAGGSGHRVKRQSWGQISIDIISNIIKPVRKAIKELPDLNKLAEDALNGIEQVFSALPAPEAAQDLPEGSHLAEAPVEEALSATPGGGSGHRVKRQSWGQISIDIISNIIKPVRKAIKELPDLNKLAEDALNGIEQVFSALPATEAAQDLPEGSHLAEAPVEEALSATPGGGSGHRVKRQSWGQISIDIISNIIKPVRKAIKELPDLNKLAEDALNGIEQVFSAPQATETAQDLPEGSHLAEAPVEEALSATSAGGSGHRVKRQSWGQISIDIISNIIKPVRKAIKELPDLNKLAEDALNGIEQVFSASQATEAAQDLPEGSHLAEAPVEEALSATPAGGSGHRVKRQSWGQISIDVISNIIKPVRKAIQGLPDLNKLAEDALNGIEQVFSAPQATEAAQDLPEGSHLAEAPVEEALSATSAGGSGHRVKRQSWGQIAIDFLANIIKPKRKVSQEQPDSNKLAEAPVEEALPATPAGDSSLRVKRQASENVFDQILSILPAPVADFLKQLLPDLSHFTEDQEPDVPDVTQVLPEVSHLAEVAVEDIQSVLSVPEVPDVTQILPEVSDIAVNAAKEALSVIPGVDLGLRRKREAGRENISIKVLNDNADEVDDKEEGQHLEVISAKTTKTGRKKDSGESDSNESDSSDESGSSSDEGHDTETIVIVEATPSRCKLNPLIPGCRRHVRPSRPVILGEGSLETPNDQVPVSLEIEPAGQGHNGQLEINEGLQQELQPQGFLVQSAGNLQNGQVGFNQGFQQGVQPQGFLVQSPGNRQNGQIAITQGFQKGSQSQAFASSANSQNVQTGSVSQAGFSSQGAQQVSN